MLVRAPLAVCDIHTSCDKILLIKYVGRFCAVGSRKFLGGNSPGLADLYIFGILRAISNTDTFQFIMHETRAFPWWQRMVEVVGESSRLEETVEIL